MQVTSSIVYQKVAKSALAIETLESYLLKDIVSVYNKVGRVGKPGGGAAVVACKPKDLLCIVDRLHQVQAHI